MDDNRISQLERECAVLRAEVVSLHKQMDLRLDAAGKALKLQAAENMRRLDLLNGEAERLQRMQSTYLPREVYDVSAREIHRKIAELREREAHTQGRGSVIAGVVAFAISLLFLLLNYALSKR